MSTINVTLEQARTLDALDRHGTLQRAAAALRKGHTAVMYALRQLETQTGLTLLDRRGYRLRLTVAGRRVLEHCRALLAAEAELVAACHQMRTGWEPALRVVYDGIVPDRALLRVVGELVAEQAPTHVHVSAEFLGGVEAAFARDEADLMIAVLPVTSATAGDRLVATRLPALDAHLVAHRGHPLCRRDGALDDDDLAAHVLITVRGGDPRLELPTGAIERRATVDLNDFHAKRAAILAGIGFGWLPDHLCADELRRGTLRPLRYRRGHRHSFAPRLYHRAGVRLGPAARRVVEALQAGA
ncbi:MAG: LysR family transcriptional regulator [Kofleriaceae bacterium]|nr:LysR family transcriptional regulator [Myxococcales bacterium]MCB9564519.1 LysR family transcriptional regulator [Kofleriaceae bacterium]